MISLLETTSRKILLPVELLLGKLFGDKDNPCFQLGALSFLFFWIVAISGIYLFIFFDTSISGAYQSVEAMTYGQWYLGGIMRSLHRYASDAMVITVTLHLIREFSLGRFRGARWFSWLTGVPLLWLLFASAIGGYWLVWDELAKYIAVTTSEWLDWLPFFGEPLARNFMHNDALSDRLFSLLVFLHIALPLFLLLGMFIHIKRITTAKSNPSRGLVLGVVASLLILSLIKPAISSAPADMQIAPEIIQLDWIILNIYPVIEHLGHGQVWGFLMALSLILAILPWTSKQGIPPAVVVDPDNCNGCSWCFQDCPYEAVEMKAHDYKAGHKQSVVDADLCTGCGICIGACPSATPFRSVTELITGIDFPDATIHKLLQSIETEIEKTPEETKILLIGCDHAASTEAIQIAGVAKVSLGCIAQLPPSFLTYFLKEKQLDGIFISGCGADCFYRQGNDWMQQRLNSERMPHLRASVAKDRICLSSAGPLEVERLINEVEEFKKAIASGKVSPLSLQGRKAC